MKTLVLLFHPEFQNSTINKKMYDTINGIRDVTIRNMYELYPDFKIDVKQEQKYMEDADRIILQFPIRWYSSPALLKQWEDDVFEAGWAYMGGHALDDKEFTVAVSFGADGYKHGGYSYYTPHEILRPFQATAYRIGMKFMKPFVLTNVARADDAKLDNQIEQYRNFVSQELAELDDLG